ncbi:hypothetical protein GIB67_030790 [Kingdonia uniflora]|uniref:Argonaute linker 2 domain-containing protein n=1 Tax=Kingdonia uniflora TaxID=39325 RepID=A0A7J7L304_9MAGN|nr:hypothetical protein GIB67_030790 [Kingdonia uniflora]
MKGYLQTVESYTIWCLGKGNKKFWFDDWTGEGSLSDILNIECTQQFMVKDILMTDGTWKWELLEHEIPPHWKHTLSYKLFLTKKTSPLNLPGISGAAQRLNMDGTVAAAVWAFFGNACGVRHGVNDCCWTPQGLLFQAASSDTQMGNVEPCLNYKRLMTRLRRPLEVCRIVEGQRYSKSLSEKQVTSLFKVTCQRPYDRERDIVKAVHHNDYDEDPYAKEFGLKINNKLATIEARILPTLVSYNKGLLLEGYCYPCSFRLKKVFRKIHVRLTMELEKKFKGKMRNGTSGQSSTGSYYDPHRETQEPTGRLRGSDLIQT